MHEMEFHEVANIFPMMSAEEFADLKRDIELNGQLTPIWIYQNKIVDGRNRYQACVELGIEPHYSYVPGSPELSALVTFVMSLNAKRRHLNSGQKAFVALEVERILAEDAKRRQGTRNDLNPTLSQDCDKVERHPVRSSQQAAKIAGTSQNYVLDAKKIEREAPELKQAVMSGEITLPQAKRELKERERETRREENRKIIQTVPSPSQAIVDAKFATIVIDPPWDWGDEGDVDQMGRARPDYATMSFEKLMELPVSDLADVDCHLYLWITNRSLPKGFALLEKWGFRYVTCLTWVKPHFGMGNYFRGQTEQVLFGVRGSQMLKRRDVGTVFHATRGSGGHSSKPEEFFALVESCSPGPYLEMFGRQEREQWVSWGESSVIT
jgi:N6-adenosine-specific RNA methylase IME4